MIRLLRGELAQGTVELALALALVLLPMTMGMLEFGYLFSQAISVNTATREGARIGGALANGGGPLGCGAGQSPNASGVDPQIVAAVQRSLTASGGLVDLPRITEIRIFKSTSTGAETAGKVNVWTYSSGGGPVVDGQPLDFAQSTLGWDACARVNTLPADSVGVTIRYTYRLRTPLRYIFSTATLPISDTTRMTLNATQ